MSSRTTTTTTGHTALLAGSHPSNDSRSPRPLVPAIRSALANDTSTPSSQPAAASRSDRSRSASVSATPANPPSSSSMVTTPPCSSTANSSATSNSTPTDASKPSTTSQAGPARHNEPVTDVSRHPCHPCRATSQANYSLTLTPERGCGGQEQVVGAGLPATRSFSHCTRSSCAATMTVPCVAPSYTR